MDKPMLVVANWKMHGSISFINSYIDELLRDYAPDAQSSLVMAVPFIYVPALAERLQNKSISLAAQNVSAYEKGPYTGEVAAPMLGDFGCDYAIIGHSERRQYFAEDNQIILRKVQEALKYGIRPILCVGETEKDFNQGKRETVVQAQLEAVLAGVDKTEVEPIVFAYEPVWAIGTGLTATPEQAQAMHGVIRDTISQHAGATIAAGATILYGGSVKPGNAQSLVNQQDVDGFLVGSASLNPQSLLKIYHVKPDSQQGS